MNVTVITKRIEALEQRKAESPKRRVVWRIIDDGRVVGGYAGEITPDMLVIDTVIVDPMPLDNRTPWFKHELNSHHKAD